MEVKKRIAALLWRDGQAILGLPDMVYAMNLPAGTPLTRVVQEAHRAAGRLADELKAEVSWNSQRRLFVFTQERFDSRPAAPGALATSCGSACPQPSHLPTTLQ